MITLMRIIAIRLLAGRKIQIALNFHGEVRINPNGKPIYIGPGIQTSLPGRAPDGWVRNLPPESPRTF